jgi:hypothetical protein
MLGAVDDTQRHLRAVACVRCSPIPFPHAGLPPPVSAGGVARPDAGRGAALSVVAIDTASSASRKEVRRGLVRRLRSGVPGQPGRAARMSSCRGSARAEPTATTSAPAAGNSRALAASIPPVATSFTSGKDPEVPGDNRCPALRLETPSTTCAPHAAPLGSRSRSQRSASAAGRPSASTRRCPGRIRTQLRTRSQPPGRRPHGPAVDRARADAARPFLACLYGRLQRSV